MSVDDSYTTSLLHFNGTNNSTTFTDESGRTWGIVNAIISNAQNKFGGTSASFAGNGYIIADSTSAYALGTIDFTLDLWFYLNSTAGTISIIDFRPGGTNGLYPLIYISSNTIRFYVNSADRITGSTSLQTGRWYHLALTRSGTSTKLFINGTKEGSTYTDSNDYIVGTGNRPIVCADCNGGSNLNGYIDEFRLSKGIARWTSDFTPPTSEYGPTPSAKGSISAYLSGEDLPKSSTPSYLKGKDNTKNSISSYLKGQNVAKGSKSAFLSGKNAPGSTTTSRSAYLHGSNIGKSSKAAYLEGTLSNSRKSSVSAYLSGYTQVTPGGTNTYTSQHACIAGYSQPATAIQNTVKGYPCILFSARPYSAFSFQASARFKLVGDYTWVGIVGLASDALNYIVARVNLAGDVQICKVKDGDHTILATSTTPSVVDTIIFFEHRNGVFSVRFLVDYVLSDPVLTYKWQKADGPMCVSPDLFHVGVYSFLDPPHFRMTSFDLNMADGIPLLPGADRTGYDLLPSSGIVDVEGTKYNYTGKTPTGITHRGPYKMYGVGSVKLEGYSGKCAEICWFDFLDNVTHRHDYDGYLLASDQLYAWLIRDINFDHVYTKSKGHKIYLRNRARIYCKKAGGQVADTDKIWITEGLTGISISSGSTAGQHANMTLVFLDSEDSSTLLFFNASSGDIDATIGDMISHITRMSGAQPNFPGDITFSSITVTNLGVQIL